MPTRGHTTVSYSPIDSLKTSILLNFEIILVSKTGTHFINQFKNPNDMWHAWKNTFNFVVEKHAPLYAQSVSRPLKGLGFHLT